MTIVVDVVAQSPASTSPKNVFRFAFYYRIILQQALYVIGAVAVESGDGF